MKPKFADLYEEFPRLYAHGHQGRDPGFWIGDGWYGPIKQLSVELTRLILLLPEENQKDYYAVQIKDKFGGLRFYMNKSTKEMNEAIDECEFICSHTCCKCGEKGEKESGNGAPVCVPCFVHDS